MTLEEDNKSEPETPTNSTAPTAAAASSSTSSPGEEAKSATGAAATSTTITQKRSFDEISTTNGPAVVSCDDVASSTVDASGDGEPQEEKMLTDDATSELVVSTSDPPTGEDDEPQTCSSSSNKSSPPDPAVLVTFKVVYAKQPYELSLDLNTLVSELKTELHKLTGVTQPMQKLCFKGNLEDHKTLEESGIKNGSKVLLIGTKMDDVKAMDESKPETSSKSKKEEKAPKEPLCQQKQHKKILEKGVPEFATPGWMNEDCSLPGEPLTGMVNKYGNKVRLTFKFEADQLWIGTKENTQKLPMTNVKSVISEPIEGHPEYHMVGLQVGTTEASRLWFYWVPAQYVKAIKRAILNE